MMKFTLLLIAFYIIFLSVNNEDPLWFEGRGLSVGYKKEKDICKAEE